LSSSARGRVALAHDWLTGLRGGERVLDELAGMFPDADLYTLIHVPGSTSERIEKLRIHTSPLSRLPGVATRYRALLPLFPWAIERFRLPAYDLVVSTSHAVAKGIRVAPGTLHVCYCFTPMRYVWDQADAYLGRGLRRALAAPLAAGLRRWDVRTSTPERVHRFVAISRTIADRIARHYGRSAEVIYPPVDVARVQGVGEVARGDFFLLVGGFVPYKREDVAIEAFRALGWPLVVAGDGPGRARLEAAAPPNVRFTGRISDDELARLYAGCRALVYPQDEDFGIVPVEAQAAGAPVIAYARGGATETVVAGSDDPAAPAPATGLWFEPQTPEALVAALRRFAEIEARFDRRGIRAHADRFSCERFRAEMSAFLQRAQAEGARA
jgi:glycosyltransferase involved in cell wall biosynthesis